MTSAATSVQPPSGGFVIPEPCPSDTVAALRAAGWPTDREHKQAVMRAAAEAREIERLIFAEPEKPKAAPRPGFKRFTTKRAIAYGKAQGWTLIDRERWNPWARGGKGGHEDAMLASDAVFVKSGGGIVLIQGAGKGQKDLHRRKFEDRGGVAKCQEIAAEFLYIEFARNVTKPLLFERWA